MGGRMAKNVLGRGLGALIQTRPPGSASGGGIAPTGTGAMGTPATGEVVRKIALDEIRSSPFQPRHDFKPESLQELVDSIREQGIIQPLIVRKVGSALRTHRRGTALARRQDAGPEARACHRARGERPAKCWNSRSSKTSSAPT